MVITNHQSPVTTLKNKHQMKQKSVADIELFREKGHELIDLLADYYKNINETDFSITVQGSPQEMLTFWEEDFHANEKDDWTVYFENILKHDSTLYHNNMINQ